ncbi:hypothetical protein O6P43_020056 [Quillaja saponaria]|uniref:Uncharacterized protein n=1 Tax=Quillaja saponaria TaxID=32244 RepID=A0AAD7LLZ9_QUISA|nr:hypothetical protein O6P43_020056 [Quillaja saponaria]
MSDAPFCSSSFANLKMDLDSASGRNGEGSSRKRKRSNPWVMRYFTVEDYLEDNKTCKCNFCEATYVLNLKTSGTINLKKSPIKSMCVFSEAPIVWITINRLKFLLFVTK